MSLWNSASTNPWLVPALVALRRRQLSQALGYIALHRLANRSPLGGIQQRYFKSWTVFYTMDRNVLGDSVCPFFASSLDSNALGARFAIACGQVRVLPVLLWHRLTHGHTANSAWAGR